VPTSALILTVDHEVFGDGSGCIEACMIRPLERLLGIAEQHGARVSIFLEPLHLEASERLGRAREVEAAVKQVRAASERGHDVQLHLHPQWWPTVERRQDTPDLSLWRIGGLDQASVEQMIVRGLGWLRARLGERVADRVNVFRAGGWCIQPEADVLRALGACGFAADSTVAPGVWNPVGENWHDFRNAPALPYWKVDERLDEPSRQGLLEIPICTGTVSPLRHIASYARKRFSGSGGLAEGCKGHYQAFGGALGTAKQRFRRLTTAGRTMLDFSTLSAGLMRDIVTTHIAAHRGASGTIPIVAIGHSKNFDRRAAGELDALLAWASGHGDVHFATYNEWLNSGATT
jgi:hypothetical protein